MTEQSEYLDKDQEIRELSDMVMSLSETQANEHSLEQILAALDSMPAGFIEESYDIEGTEDVLGNDEVVRTILGRVFKEGLGEVPVKGELIFLPEALDQNTKELVSIFALSLALKLLKAKQKYGYTDGWRHPDWYNDCLHEFKEHIEKGDPRDVAAFAMFMWFHGWTTNGNSAQTAQ